MIRRPPRSTRVRSSAASDVYKRQVTDSFQHSVLIQHFSVISVSSILFNSLLPVAQQGCSGPTCKYSKRAPSSPKKLLKKQRRANFGPPHSAGPACTARLARPTVTPLCACLNRKRTGTRLRQDTYQQQHSSSMRLRVHYIYRRPASGGKLRLRDERIISTH